MKRSNFTQKQKKSCCNLFALKPWIVEILIQAQILQLFCSLFLIKILGKQKFYLQADILQLLLEFSVLLCLLESIFLRTEVSGDFNIHGTKYS